MRIFEIKSENSYIQTITKYIANEIYKILDIETKIKILTKYLL